MTERKFYRREYKLVILSETKPTGHEDPDELAYEISQGVSVGEAECDIAELRREEAEKA